MIGDEVVAHFASGSHTSRAHDTYPPFRKAGAGGGGGERKCSGVPRTETKVSILLVVVCSKKHDSIWSQFGVVKGS